MPADGTRLSVLVGQRDGDDALCDRRVRGIRRVSGQRLVEVIADERDIAELREAA